MPFSIASLPPTGQLVADIEPQVDARLAPDFASMVARCGTTVEAVARQIGVDILLLQNVARGRQALPHDVAILIADVLVTPVFDARHPHAVLTAKVDVNTVLGLAKTVTMRSGPLYRVPLPEDPLVGDSVTATPVGRLQPVDVQPKPTPAGMMCVGAGLAPLGSGDDGVILVDRSRDQFASVDLGGALANSEEFVVGPGGLIYITSPSGITLVRVSYDPATAALTVVDQVTDPGNLLAPKGMAYEPTTGTVWAANTSTGGGLYVMLTPPPSYTATSFEPFGAAHTCLCQRVITTGGKIYATATTTAPSSAVVEVDPSSHATLRQVSTNGTDTLTDPYGIATDGVGHLLIVDAGTNKVHAIDLATFTLSPPLGLPTMTGPTLVFYSRGIWWVTDASSVPRLLRFKVDFNSGGTSPAVTLLGDFSLGAIAAQGNTRVFVADDADGHAWASFKRNAGGDGFIVALNEQLSSGDPTVHSIDFAGTPQKLAFL
jgi:DNA-binding beta-propeller fold protein YncE